MTNDEGIPKLEFQSEGARPSQISEFWFHSSFVIRNSLTASSKSSGVLTFRNCADHLRGRRTTLARTAWASACNESWFLSICSPTVSKVVRHRCNGRPTPYFDHTNSPSSERPQRDTIHH